MSVGTSPSDYSDEDLEELAARMMKAINRPREGDMDDLGDGPGGWLQPLDLPGFGSEYDDCGDARRHFCSDCGHSFEVGRTCSRSMCPRCGASWVLNRAATSRENGRDVPGLVAQLDKTARMMSSRLDTAVYKHHIVMSPPMNDWFLEAADPLDRTFEVIRELMDILGLEGVAFYHPWAGDNEDHEGDDRGQWKNRVFSGRDWEGDVKDELIPRGHFHIVACSPFVPGAGVTDRVFEGTGWIIKRITKRGSSNKSLDDLEDVAKAVTYCLSHTGIDTSGKTNQAAYRKYGSTYHSGEVPDRVRDAADAAVRKVAPSTLGIPAKSVTCYNEVPESEACNDDCTPDTPDDGDGDGDDDLEQPDDQEEMKLVPCSGRVHDISEAGHFLESEDWRDRATFSRVLERHYEDWLSERPPDA